MRPISAASRNAAPVAKVLHVAGYLLVAFVAAAASLAVVRRLGGDGFALVLVGLLVAAVYSYISFRNLSAPFIVWVLAVGGFRFIWSIEAPMLPDLYLDRMAQIWLMLVFMVKTVVERRPLRGPLLLDLMVLVHGLYLLGQVAIQEMEAFHTWTTCILIPYSGYFLGKFIVHGRREIRSLMWALLILSVYYNVTAVAEKYEIDWLLWPKYMVESEGEFRGRSGGPFQQAPLFGTILGMLLPLNLYFMSTVRSSLGRAMVALNLLLGLAGLYFTYTRGSWVVGIVALGVAAMLNRRAYMRLLVPALIIGPIVAIGFLGLAQDEFMKERVENEDTIGARLGTAVTVLRVWRDHPLFGVGFFQYKNVRDQYVQAVEIPGMPTIRFVQFRRNAIHDIYLGPLAETGLVGMFLQAMIYFLIWRALWEKYRLGQRGDHFGQMVAPVFAGLMAGYMMGGLVIDYRFFSVVGTLFMVCAGITYGYRPDAEPAPSLANDMPHGLGRDVAGIGTMGV